MRGVHLAILIHQLYTAGNDDLDGPTPKRVTELVGPSNRDNAAGKAAIKPLLIPALMAFWLHLLQASWDAHLHTPSDRLTR